MKNDELGTLQQRILAEFGREMSLQEIAGNRERLGRMLTFAERVAAWKGRLDLIEPASVSSLFGGRAS